MAKKSSLEEKHTTAKLGLNVHHGAKVLLDTLSILKNSSQSDILVFGLLLVLENSSSSQKDAINSMIKASGFSLRDIKKSVSYLDIGAGQGISSDFSEQSSILIPESRISTISRIHSKSSIPLDNVIKVEYGGD